MTGSRAALTGKADHTLRVPSVFLFWAATGSGIRCKQGHKSDDFPCVCGVLCPGRIPREEHVVLTERWPLSVHRCPPVQGPFWRQHQCLELSKTLLLLCHQELFLSVCWPLPVNDEPLRTCTASDSVYRLCTTGPGPAE